MTRRRPRFLTPMGYPPDPELSSLLEAAEQTIDPEVLDSVYRSMWPILSADFPVTYLHPEVDVLITNHRIKDLNPSQAMDRVWVEEGGR